MKIAGRKNDGAWVRTNKVIKSLNVTQQEALATSIESMTSMGSWFEMVEQFQELGGIDLGDPSYISSASELALQYVTEGIPRQAWYGVLSYDTYTRSGTPGAYEYEPDHQAIAHEFGKELRELMKDFTFSRRQGLDLANKVARDQGNPGGIADATEGN